MSELLTAVAATLGAPEELIQRSADARAAADGVDVGQVLQAWTGGGVSVAATPAPPEVPALAEAPTPAETASVVEQVVEEPMEPMPAVAVAVVEPTPQILSDFEPAPLASRIRVPAILGAAVGAMFGLLTGGVAAVFFVDNAAVVERGDEFRAVVQADVLAIVIGTALLSAVFGAFLGVVGRRAPAFFRQDLAVMGASGIWLGALVGLALGAIGGGILAGVLGVDTLELGIVAIPVAPALWWLVIGGALLGADTAVISHVTAVPAGLSSADLADSGEVRTRLTQSLMLPLVAIGVLVVVIALVATLFLLFHEAASALAIAISAGVLLFAFLGGYRPSIKLRYTEVIAAFAGIATVVVAIVMVVLVRGH